MHFQLIRENWDSQIKRELETAGITPIVGFRTPYKLDAWTVCGVLGGTYDPVKFERYFKDKTLKKFTPMEMVKYRSDFF